MVLDNLGDSLKRTIKKIANAVHVDAKDLDDTRAAVCADEKYAEQYSSWIEENS